MIGGFLAQFALSAVAIGVMVALAAWARIARPLAPLDDARARALLAEEFPGHPIDALWVGADGAGALAKSGALGLIVCRIGDGYAARQTTWAQVLSARFKDGKLSVDLGDAGAPRALIALPAWPPGGADGSLAA